jgi:glucose-6-phosphate isomerase
MKSNYFPKELYQHFDEISKLSLNDLFHNDVKRADKFCINFDGLYFDYSKNNITQKTIDLLLDFAKSKKLSVKIQEMFSGVKINNTENRSVLHTALRSKEQSILVDGVNVMPQIEQVKKQMEEFCHQIHSGAHKGYTDKKIDTIVNLGIGGSDLGPVLITQALKPYRVSGMKIHFVSSVDGYMLNDVLSEINPETTLFVIASKTFTTQETMTNAHSARKWFIEQAKNESAIAKHFIALSTNQQAVEEFGISLSNMFAFWDFVGGRYSSWSAIGLSVALYIGWDNFQEFLDGANAMDQHFAETGFEHNLPVILAIIGVWYTNFYDYRSLVISPYNTRLTRFPAYVQQLEMESNGKSVNFAGNKLDYLTCPVVWGDSGINAQHAYYQLLHQGMQIIPMDIIVALSDKFSDSEHNKILWSNAIAQAEAFMHGKTFETAKEELLKQGYTQELATELAKHKVFEGNRPTNILVLPEISPYYLGMLIALYEHKTFVQGIMWDINSFDQMGVELGKQLAKQVLNDLQHGNDVISHDASTNKIINYFIKNN